MRAGLLNSLLGFEKSSVPIPVGPNLISNSGFGVWSNSTLENVGDQISVSAIALGVCTTADTEGLVVGKLVKFGAGGSTANKVYEVTAVTANTNFTIHDTSISDETDVTCYEVTPGCVAADALAMDGWWKNAAATFADIWREHTGTNIKAGNYYALKIQANESGQDRHGAWWPGPSGKGTDPVLLKRVAGKTMTFGAWVKCDTAACAYLGYTDIGGSTLVAKSSAHTGSNDWEWLEMTFTVTASPSDFRVGFNLQIDTKIAYISQPILVFGSHIGQGNYQPIPGEFIPCEAQIQYTLPTANTAVNVEAVYNGKVPKGARALLLSTYGSNTAAGEYIYYSAGSSGIISYVLRFNVASQALEMQGIVILDSNGDYYLTVSDADTTAYAQVKGVYV